MTEHGLMPDDEGARKALELKDPYELRAKALDEKLSLHELGRALFHINQRRGFKSNRKTDTMASDRGAIKEGVAKLEQLLRTTNSRTLGEYLAGRNRRREGTRARPDIVDHTASYEFHPSRAMCEHELDLILQKQGTFYPGLIRAIGADLKSHHSLSAALEKSAAGPVYPGARRKPRPDGLPGPADLANFEAGERLGDHQSDRCASAAHASGAAASSSTSCKPPNG